jgi:hypothetical protein
MVFCEPYLIKSTSFGLDDLFQEILIEFCSWPSPRFGILEIIDESILKWR